MQSDLFGIRLKDMGGRLCGTNDFQSARGSLSMCLHLISKERSTLGFGSVYSAETETPCQLNEGNGWIQSDLFGIR